jgi:hypothetical protein
MRVVPPETSYFLLQPMLCVLHERRITTMPEFAVPLDRSMYAVADGLDRILLYHFAVKWWKFLMPVHDLGSSVSRRTHGDILLSHKGGESISVTALKFAAPRYRIRLDRAFVRDL